LLPDSNITMTEHRPPNVRSSVDDLDCHPDPPQDGEGSPICNFASWWREALIATARSLSALRRIGMTKRPMAQSFDAKLYFLSPGRDALRLLPRMEIHGSRF
jgi:hypothetical protein